VPAEMQAFFRLTGEMVLVQNAKKDAYYITTSKACSCPAKTYNVGASVPEPVDSIRPTGKWIGGYSGPVEELRSLFNLTFFRWAQCARRTALCGSGRALRPKSSQG